MVVSARRGQRLFDPQFSVVREPVWLRVAHRVRFASFEFSVALVSLELLILDCLVAYRARLLRLAISAAPGEGLLRVSQPKSQRN